MPVQHSGPAVSTTPPIWVNACQLRVNLLCTIRASTEHTGRREIDCDILATPRADDDMGALHNRA